MDSPQLPQQQHFAFSRDEKRMLIEAADFGQSRTINRRLRALLLNLEWKTGRAGCFPAVGTLAASMGVADRTVQRLLRLAARLGLITLTPRIVPGFGQVETLYSPQWDRLRSFVSLSERARIDHKLGRIPAGRRSPTPAPELSPGPPNCHRPPCHHVTGPGDTMTPRLIDQIDPIEAAGEADRLQLVEAVGECGVHLAADAVDSALGRGCSAQEIAAAVAAYRERAGLYESPGGPLYVKLLRMRPGQPAGEGWPKPSPSRARAARREQDRGQVERQTLATKIIKRCRLEDPDIPDERIAVELAAAGLTWGDA